MFAITWKLLQRLFCSIISKYQHSEELMEVKVVVGTIICMEVMRKCRLYKLVCNSFIPGFVLGKLTDGFSQFSIDLVYMTIKTYASKFFSPMMV